MADVDVRGVLQKDNTGPPGNLVYSVQVGVTLPIYDRNQGNIRKAQADLLQAEEEGRRVRDGLTSRLAEAYGRYIYNRQRLEYFQKFMLPDQVRAFRGVSQSHQVEPPTNT